MNYWQNKKILITGGDGFLGKHTINKLLLAGADKNNIVVPHFPEVDLREKQDCLKVINGVDVVIHLAATVGGIEFNRHHPGKIFYDNAAMSLNIIEASRIEGVKKFVGIGSACEYPKIIPVPFKEKNLWDGYPESTNAPYGLSKKFMLVQSQAYKMEYDLNCIHILMLNLYGPGDNFDPKSSHVIPATIKRIFDAKKAGDNHITAWGTGKSTRGFLYVEDAAEGVVMAAEKYDNPEPSNLGSAEEVSIKELVNLICEIVDFNGEIRWDTSKPNGQPRRALDVSRAENEFGFKAKTPFTQGLKKTINWYIENYKK